MSLSVSEKPIAAQAWERVTYFVPCLQTRVGQISLAALAGLALFLALVSYKRSKAGALKRIVLFNNNFRQALFSILSPTRDKELRQRLLSNLLFSWDNGKKEALREKLEKLPIWRCNISPDMEIMLKEHSILLGEWRDKKENIHPAIYIRLNSVEGGKESVVFSAKCVNNKKWELFDTEDNKKICPDGAAVASQKIQNAISSLLINDSAVLYQTSSSGVVFGLVLTVVGHEVLGR